MQGGEIRVGLLGVNPLRGWGMAVHVPVIAALPEFTLQAVGTTRQESAEASAKKFGAKLAFSDPLALVSHPEVDMVAITVKAPEHHHLAMLALEAGKHVYCEWPLATNSGLAEEMRDTATAQGVQTIVGLQARAAPALVYARDLLRDGFLGRMVAARLVCALPGGGGRRSAEGLYVIDKANGASTLAIQGGHSIDALRFLVGDFVGFSAVVDNQFDEVEVIETGETRGKDAPDQVLLSGRLANGAVVSVCLNGGAVAGFGIEIMLIGTEGSLSISANGPLNFQMSELQLRGARLPTRALASLEIPASYDCALIPETFRGETPYPGVEVPRATLVNVAKLYQRIAAGILRGTPVDPDFAVAAEMHRLLESMERASETGGYQQRLAFA